MRIKILLCDTFPGLLPDYIPSYVSMFMNLFTAADETVEYEVFRTMDGEFPPIPDHASASAPAHVSAPGTAQAVTPAAGPASGELYLITGCNLGAYDDVPWIGTLLDWIRKADKAEIKLTGICFGHQAIAQALGGKVEKSAKGWGCGIRESEILDEDMLKFFPDHKMRLLYNHHDQVTILPPRAKLCATSAFCPVESFRIGNHILTFQGHPEYIPEYSEHLLKNFADNEPEPVKKAALSTLKNLKHQGPTIAHLLLSWASTVDTCIKDIL